jgi:hypothetical protein
LEEQASIPRVDAANPNMSPNCHAT